MTTSINDLMTEAALSLEECLSNLTTSSTTAASVISVVPNFNDFQMSLDAGIAEQLYFSTSSFGISSSKEHSAVRVGAQVSEKSAESVRLERIMKKSKLNNLTLEQSSVSALPKSKSAKTREKRQKMGKTAGKGWYDLQSPDMTPEIESDLKVIQLRGLVDSKTFFKRTTKELPKHFEVGKVIANPLDFFSEGRSKAKMHNKHFVDALLDDQKYKSHAKKRYRDIQNKRTGLKRKNSNKSQSNNHFKRRRKQAAATAKGE
eukprot:TRINITY_DN2468_c0_g1_i2.p1 TRINITY_DN2468_c0_g1~~TRINITY_DN2468_c0_g1_i2.p1  ORF type:complete len:260 (-),score=63.33 TRINITY_DN2468_c0_g1_i2:311-1090(-)